MDLHKKLPAGCERFFIEHVGPLREVLRSGTREFPLFKETETYLYGSITEAVLELARVAVRDINDNRPEPIVLIDHNRTTGAVSGPGYLIRADLIDPTAVPGAQEIAESLMVQREMFMRHSQERGHRDKAYWNDLETVMGNTLFSYPLDVLP